LTPLFEGNPLIQGRKILSHQTRILGAAQSEDFMNLARDTAHECDGQTDA